MNRQDKLIRDLFVLGLRKTNRSLRATCWSDDGLCSCCLLAIACELFYDLHWVSDSLQSQFAFSFGNWWTEHHTLGLKGLHSLADYSEGYGLYPGQGSRLCVAVSLAGYSHIFNDTINGSDTTPTSRQAKEEEYKWAKRSPVDVQVTVYWLVEVFSGEQCNNICNKHDDHIISSQPVKKRRPWKMTQALSAQVHTYIRHSR